LLELARSVAEQAADLLLAGAQRRRTSVGTKSSTTDMVTEMDRASEELIVGKLLAARPDDGILGEEGSSREGSSGVRWVIDPVDGTTNYLYGLPGWAVSIAAEMQDEVVAGVVADAVHGDIYGAARGRGASRNGEPISCSAETELSQALIATGFGYQARRRRAQTEVLVDLIAQIRDIRRFGAASVDLCMVACGRVDGYYEGGLSAWDWAAGSLIAEEAGAVVSPIADEVGDDGAARSLVAAAPGIYAPLRAILAALGAHRVP
jgi:fructose-1,6-bisphosphatase/inositol monophosphatase family enzyme